MDMEFTGTPSKLLSSQIYITACPQFLGELSETSRDRSAADINVCVCVFFWGGGGAGFCFVLMNEETA